MTSPTPPSDGSEPYGQTPHGQTPYGQAPGAGMDGSGPQAAPPVTFEGRTFPGAPAQPEPARGGVKKGLVLGTVAAVTLGVVGTAFAAASFLSGGGTQPEDVLPKGTIAFIKVDVDPAAGQKLALFRLAQKFPRAEVSSEESVKDDLLSELFEGVQGVDYDEDVKPWVGDRAGVALLPDSGDEGEDPDALVAVAYRDEAAAKQSLPDLVKAGGGELNHFAFSAAGDYVILGETQEAVDAAAEGKASLGNDARYRKAVDALGGDQILTAWADVTAVWAALPAEAKQASLEQYGEGFAPTGQLVGGLHADASFVEATGRALEFSTGVDIAQLGQGAGTGLLREFPDDLLGGISATGVGAALPRASSSSAPPSVTRSRSTRSPSRPV